MKLRLAALATTIFLSALAARAVEEGNELPPLGVVLGQLPPGDGKEVAEAACLKCHSADMLLQQRLTEKQWAKEIDKMAGWGAELPDEKKPLLLAYLTKSFGPGNVFRPTPTKPSDR